ncbi:MAG: PEGA domain-containing protein [bacterium]|nr:PEGA domain-containing protein [bacterium]MBK8130444.1 PEGA domain-containing protein [bacterium]
MPRRNSRPIVQLVGNLARIVLPLLVITAAAWWILNRDATPQGDLRVTSSVKGVDIFVDGVQTGATTDTVLTGLPTGRRLVTVRALGMIADPEVAIVEIQRDRTAVAVFTLRDSADVVKSDNIASRDRVRQDAFARDEEAVRSIPPAPARRTMMDYEEDVDRETERFERPVTDFIPHQRRSAADTTATDLGSIPIESVRALTGTQITVSSEPVGALIVVNGARTGNRTPHTFRGLDRGIYVFTLELDGHIVKPDSIEVYLTADSQAELAAFSMQPLQQLPVPQLTVQTKPLAAGIRLDGVAVGVGAATISTEYGTRIVEFADVPGYKTPEPVRISVTADAPNQEVVGTYQRLSGSAMVAVVPGENFVRFDASKLRVFVDGELILDGPKGKFDATLMGSLYPGERAIKVQYEDLVAEEIVALMDDQVAELTIRVDSMFGKRKLKFKSKTDIPLDKWQARFKKSSVLTQS